MLEILAPAGNLDCALAAINSGADAVYLGLNAFSARQGADNFDETGLFAVLEKAHFCGVKVYVAMNTIVKNEEIEGFFKALVFAWNLGADAIILQDPFLGKLIHERYPQIVLHLSTQAGVCNTDGAKFAKACGFSRVILARETPIHEIQEIAKIIETEVFVQGALCTAFSGQCYFSSFAGGNSGNRGRCKQPCRKQYAYDRNGNTEKCYALSLSDLCVGEDIQKLISAGVTSFKIEGRMRRAEYVASAVRYYRALLDGEANKETALSNLKRTYNRGNYTKGLAFGQDKRLLSTAVQGHLGEKVGVVKVVNGKFFVESKFKPRMGDAFKILREGKEVGGASFSKAEGRGFILYSKHRLKNGDGVFVTTDTEVNERVLQGERKGKVPLSLTFKENEKAIVEGNGVCVHSNEPLQSAQSRPLTEDELKSCFLKTDGLFAEVEFEKVQLQGNIFLPKSELNAIRRAFFTKLRESTASQGREKIAEWSPILPVLTGTNGKTAVLATDFEGVEADIAVYKPDDMRAPLPESFVKGDFEKYIEYPAFCTKADSRRLQEWLLQADIQGIYAENYAGIEFAKANGLKVFAGTGLNLINSLSISAFLSLENASYYAFSKECNEKEGIGLVSDKSFALAVGNIKLMELCYCPFGKTCSVCDKKEVYMLTDENGRIFPVRRHISADGACRFEVYNCADLIGQGVKGAGRLADLTLIKEKTALLCARTEEEQKTVLGACTSGHLKRGVL